MGMDYLVELMQDKKNLSMFPKLFKHVDRLVDHEISQVRSALFQFNFADGGLDLPDPVGEPVIMREKVYIPVDDFPEFNFVGRILGPRGMTAKQLEQDTGCKIMIRGKGSVRDRLRESQDQVGKQLGSPLRRGKSDQAEDNLHVLIQCEDAPNRARKRIQLAVKHVTKLLVPMQDGSDELKRKQLMELSLINGTYKPIRSPRNLSSTPSPTQTRFDFKLQSPPKRRERTTPMSISGGSTGTSISSKSLSVSPQDSSTDNSVCSTGNLASPRLSSAVLRSYLPGYFPPSPNLFDNSRSPSFFDEEKLGLV